MSVRSVLRECALDLLETESKVSAEHVVKCAYARHGEMFAEETEKMVLDHARKVAADIMRSFSDDDGGEQLTIPGLGFPTAIGVVTPDGNYWVRTDKATWPEIEAGERQRMANVDAAVAKLDSYREGKELVRPYMEHDHSVDVAAAIRMMGGES
jgi:hypothetical protein